MDTLVMLCNHLLHSTGSVSSTKCLEEDSTNDDY